VELIKNKLRKSFFQDFKTLQTTFVSLETAWNKTTATSQGLRPFLQIPYFNFDLRRSFVTALCIQRFQPTTSVVQSQHANHCAKDAPQNCFL
jgi:hypothetical protein